MNMRQDIAFLRRGRIRFWHIFANRQQTAILYRTKLLRYKNHKISEKQKIAERIYGSAVYGGIIQR